MSAARDMSYADHCIGKMKAAILEERWEDAAFFARAISTEFKEMEKDYMGRHMASKAPLPASAKRQP